jgi:prepilin-type N-terminal cleavage/methylation domain-containing protein/prepilin-type processing-associated H-X9-DG protein
VEIIVMTSTRRGGFTLIELLVVIAIIAVLIGLLVPAVQKVREAANRMQCTNNLKQLGLAAMNYESTNGHIPPSATFDVTVGIAAPYPGIAHSWAPNLLPYIEQDALYKAYNMKYPWGSSPSIVPGTPDNQAVLKNQIKTFLCPSSPGGNNRTCSGTSIGIPYSGLAPTDYATCSSINSGSITFFGYPATATYTTLASSMQFQVRGPAAVIAAFGLTASEPNRIASILDGTTNTILMCEDAGRPFEYIGRTLKSSTSRGDGAWGNHENDYGLDGCVSMNSQSGPGNFVINATNDNETYSFHTGGANLVFTDGSVRFAKESMSPTTYAALITARGAGLTTAETSPSTD